MILKYQIFNDSFFETTSGINSIVNFIINIDNVVYQV